MTEVTYVITNGGDDVRGRGFIEYHRPGNHDGSAITSANSGGSVRMPAGNYDVYVRFEDGTAKKEMWFDNQAFTGKVDKTVEVNVAMTEVTYVITNGGDDVRGRGFIEYHRPGNHDGSAITSANSGGSVRMPVGNYDVYVRFEDGTAKKEMWFDNQPFTGKVEKTVEVNVAMTEVTYVITNGGADVRGRGFIEYPRPGNHDGSAITSANSGGSVRMPVGNYDVYVRIQDGTAKKEMWFDNQPFAGKVEKTVEVNVAMTEVTYVITNGGDDVRGRGFIEYHRPGNHDGSAITWANSGGSVRMPAGNYDVYVRFTDGTAKKELWFDNQPFSGKVEKTVEVNVAMTEVRYIITNNGDDVGGKGYVEYHPAGHHDGSAITWANSGGSVRMPAGNYDVYVRFTDGTAKKELWFDNQPFSGKVEKTVEVNVAMTEVRYIITNNGDDVGGKGYVEYHPAGHHDGSAITWANSGGSVRMPAGNYDVYVRFTDGTAKKELWFDNQPFSGKVEKTVEVNVAMTEVRYIITNNGDDVGGKGYVEYHPAGHHDGSAITWANSGGSVRMPAGNYDVYVRFTDGTAKKELWFDNQPFSGKVEKTVEVNVAMTEVTYVITNGGDDVRGRGFIEYHRPGNHDGPAITSANSGGSVRMPVGNYDVYVRFEDGTAKKEMWFDNQPFTGKVEKTVEVNVAMTEVTYVITNGGDDVRGRGFIEYHRPGNHDGPAITSANSGGSVRMPVGNYDVYVRFEDGTAKKEMWFDNQAFTGKVEKTVEMSVAVTEVTYIITNGGDDVRGRGYIEYHRPGIHDGPAITSANSGGSVRMPAGNYDVYVRFEDGTAKKEMWFDNQP